MPLSPGAVLHDRTIMDDDFEKNCMDMFQRLSWGQVTPDEFMLWVVQHRVSAAQELDALLDEVFDDAHLLN